MPTTAASIDAGAGGDCALPPLRLGRPSEAENPPVLLFAEGELGIFVDGTRTFSGPEAPRRMSVGQHEVRIEHGDGSSHGFRVQLEPFAPFLLHVAVDPQLGASAVMLGARCVSCPAPLAPVDLARVSDEETDASAERVSDATRLARAAEHLRRNQWPRAASQLRSVKGAAYRRTREFHRLASSIHAFAGQQRAALEEARRASRDAPELQGLLDAYASLVEAEQRRRAEVVSLRWNELTERFLRLLQSFEPAAPGAAAAAAQRLRSLSTAFEAAARNQKLAEQEDALAAAAATLRTWVTQLQSSRPKDCDFQRAVLQAASG